MLCEAERVEIMLAVKLLKTSMPKRKPTRKRILADMLSGSLKDPC